MLLEGSLTSPWFGNQFKPDFYKRDLKSTYFIQLPNTIAEVLGNGSLVIGLETKTGVEEGWVESFSFQSQRKYQHHIELKNWEDAEKFCIKGGGHLASITNEMEQQEMSIMNNGDIWIGGKKENGSWIWRNNKTCNFIEWNYAFSEYDGNCSYLWYWYGTAMPMPGACGLEKPFLCRIDPDEFKENTNITWILTKDDLTLNTFQLQWEYQSKYHSFHNRNETMTGFSLKWHIENGRSTDFEMRTRYLMGNITTPRFKCQVDLATYQQSFAYKVSLEFPENLNLIVGDGSLVIDLDVNTREEEGWSEHVETSIGELKIFWL